MPRAPDALSPPPVSSLPVAAGPGSLDPDAAADLSWRYAAPQHPGGLLRDDVLSGLGISVSQAARDLAVTRQTLHRILSGHAAISVDMAARLEKFCGIPSEFWLDCQYRYELRRARSALAPVLSAIPHRPLPAGIVEKIRRNHGG